MLFNRLGIIIGSVHLDESDYGCTERGINSGLCPGTNDALEKKVIFALHFQKKYECSRLRRQFSRNFFFKSTT